MDHESSQRARIRAHLLAGKSIDPLQALKMFGCLRLSGRIYELIHDEKLDIESKLVTDKRTLKRYARYTLAKAA